MRAVLLVLILIPAAGAVTEVLEASTLELEAQWSGVLTTDVGARPSFTSLEARVNLVPESYVTIPESRESDGAIIFEWRELRDRYTYVIATNTTTRLSGGLTQSEVWPTQTRDLLETDLIDYTHPDVRRFAAGIGEGETDVLRLAVRAADAVRERIEYNLSTINIEARFSASDVLARGEGVCDEISVLYIATMRALGVPARYVSGYAYTDIFDPDGTWEAHGWTEVYIAGTWVPFDLTYNEYIHLSAAHLPIRRSDDAASTRISYEWYARNVDITAERLETDITITDIGAPVRFGSLDARFVHERVGPGYNELEVTVHNEKDSFLAPILSLSRTQGLDVPSEVTVIVPPRSSRSVRVPVRITETLRPRYEYTFPVSVHARGFEAADARFRADLQSGSIEEPHDADERAFHPDIDASCTDVLGLPGREGVSSCSITNTGNRNLDIEVCAERCTQSRILIADSAYASVPVVIEDGTYEYAITIRGEVTSEIPITVTGREPARVELVAETTGHTIHVDTLSDHPVSGTVRITYSDVVLEGGLGTYEADPLTFGLRHEALVTYEYEDVDGTHTLEETIVVRQSVISFVRSRIEVLLSRPAAVDH